MWTDSSGTEVVGVVGSDSDVGQAAVPGQREEPGPPDGGSEDFFRAHYRDLVRHLMYRGASKEDAQDAVGESLETLLRHWDTVEDPLAWSKTVAFRIFLKKRRHLARECLTAVGDDGADLEFDDPALSLWEDREWVMQWLKGLPPRQAEVIALMVDGWTRAEISDFFDRAPEAIRQSIHEARKRLRPTLRDDGAADPGPDTSRGEER
jgi:RNA polymerase sigma factor (sigma-70 family)